MIVFKLNIIIFFYTLSLLRYFTLIRGKMYFFSSNQIFSHEKMSEGLHVWGLHV